MVNGRRRVQIERAKEWATMLGLNEKARRRFLLLAAVSYVPGEYRSEVERLLNRSRRPKK
jgi:hypothetical protein